MSLLTRAKLRPIGDVSRVQDPVVRGILQSIKEQLDTFRGVTPNGDVLDELVSKRELFDAGIIDVLRGGQRVRGGGAASPGNVVIPPMPDLPVPPAPTDLTANGGLSVILLTWSGYGYASHAYTEIWRASVDDLSQAVMIGTAQGQSGMYADTVGGSATYYYWARFVAVRNGIVRVGPFNSTSGTVGQTGTDPSYLLDVLTGQITSSQLHNDLLAPIELIPDIALSVADIEEELQSINAVLSDIQQIPEFDDSETYNEGDLVRYEGGLYQAQTDMLTPPAPLPTNDTYWQKVGDYASLGEAVAAHSVLLADHATRIELAEGSIVAHGSDISALEAAVYDGTTGLDSKASIVQLNAAKAEIYGAEVADFTKIAAQFSSVADDLATKATITQLNTAKSDILGSAVNSFTHIAAEFSTVRGEISTAAREARDNLIINPSFENGPSPHGAGNAANGGTWSIEDEGAAYHGGKVLQYDSTGQTGTAVFRFNGQTDARLSHVEARPGDRFRMSIWHRLKSGTANRIRLRIRARSADGTILVASSTSNTVTPTSEWTLDVREWEIPEGYPDTAYIQTDIEVLADGNVGVHQFDMVRLERLDAGAYQAITSTAAAILEEAKTYADEDSAAAQLAQTLQAVVGDEESGLVAAVQANAQAIADVEGDVYAEYTIKTQLLGGQRVIAGIGLIAEPGGSSIGLMANRIFFAHPSTGADISPFVYDADTETMHVKNASIVNLTASNFVGGEITADKVVSGISVTSPTIIGGKVRNTADTNYLDLNASGVQNFLKAGANLVIRADGAINSNNQFTVDASGNVVMRSVEIRNSDGNVILSSGTGMEWAYVGGNGRPQNYAVPGANLIYDPTFEKHLAGDNQYWVENTGTDAQIAMFPSEGGSKADLALYSRSDGGTVQIYTSRNARWPARPGDVFYISARVYTSSAFNGNFRLGVGVFNRNGTQTNAEEAGSLTEQLVPGQWTTVYHRVPITIAGTETARLRVRVFGGTTGYVQVTNVYVGRVPDKITAQNNTTFLDNAVINSAHIQDAAITTAKIGTASIKLLHLDIGSVVQKNIATANFSGDGFRSNVPFPSYRVLGSAWVARNSYPDWNPDHVVVKGVIYFNKLTNTSNTGGDIYIRARVAPQIVAPVDSQSVFYYDSGVRVVGAHTPSVSTHWRNMPLITLPTGMSIGVRRKAIFEIPLGLVMGGFDSSWWNWPQAYVYVEVFMDASHSGHWEYAGYMSVEEVDI